MVDGVFLKLTADMAGPGLSQARSRSYEALSPGSVLVPSLSQSINDDALWSWLPSVRLERSLLTTKRKCTAVRTCAPSAARQCTEGDTLLASKMSGEVWGGAPRDKTEKVWEKRLT